jgi:4-hydroxy-tetrahydrodipicolinate reductase
MSTLKIAIAGASGRMGKMLTEAVLGAADCRLVGALDLAGAPSLGRDPGEFLGIATGVTIVADLDVVLQEADFLIDFTRPDGTLRHLTGCATHHVKPIIGTTGFTEQQLTQIRDFSIHQAAVLAPNMAVGVNATFKLLEIAAKILNDGYDIEIIEAHHRHKVDAPSGTALEMGRIVAKALHRSLDDCAIFGREGQTGERAAATIGFSTIRGGDIVGDHTVLFAGLGERIEITHKSSSRSTYAQGALRAVRFLAERSTGLYDMQDVLKLKTGLIP